MERYGYSQSLKKFERVMKNLSILICEDELIVAEFIKETLEKNNYNVVGIAFTRDEAMMRIQMDKPDLVLLDINMDEPMSGIKIAHYINKFQTDCDFIFITAFNDAETLESASETLPQAYLVKPLDKSTLLANLVLLKFKRESNKQQISEPIQLETETGTKTFIAEELIYVMAAANYCEFFKTKGKDLERVSLSQVAETFSKNMLRIHKSYCVNPDFIVRFTSLKAFLKDGTQLPIGRTYKESIRSFLEQKHR